MRTQVLIIGGGITGVGLARDLALRGVQCTLVEKRDINAGASGSNHGLLHSGARYVASDPAAASECRSEAALIRQTAPHCVEDTGGLFVALAGDDDSYIADFPRLCARCGIDTRPLDPVQAREMEPALSDRVVAAYAVNDAAVDPFKLSLDHIAHARQLGGRLMRHTRVSGFARRGGAITSVSLYNSRTGRQHRVQADVVVNATGAWAGQVAAMAGLRVRLHFSKGSLLVTQNRLTHRVVNRLRKPTDADILVPGGTVSVLGTTSVHVASPDAVHPEIEEVDRIIDGVSAMVPQLAGVRYIRAYCGVRPLFGDVRGGDDRSISRGFTLIDHADGGVENFFTITGGKLTTFRLMAEKTADAVCRRLGVSENCRTRTEPLPASPGAIWTQPGLAPKRWADERDFSDLLLCECEMVPQSAVDGITDAIRRESGFADLLAVSLHSRMGKGPCQGTFCSQRVTARQYDRGRYSGDQGLAVLREFLDERWRGQRPLLWGTNLVQAELMEAMHCALFGLELPKDPKEASAR